MKILLIQLRQIGDVLMITPSLSLLAQAQPEAEIHLLTERPSDQIFTYNPKVRQIWIWPKDQKQQITCLGELRRAGFDLVIDFLGLPKTALMSFLTGAKMRIGMKSRGRSLFYTHRLELPSEPAYSALQKANLLSPLGIPVQPAKLEFPTSPEDKAKAKVILAQLKRDPSRLLVAVSPVSRRDYKVWPPEKFAHCLDFLVQKYGVQILFLWGPGEEHFIEAVRQRMQARDLGNYAIPTLRETVALLEAADLHLGNDNGIRHFAVAAGTPSLAVFGRPWAKNWTPPGQEKHLSFEHDPGCKADCHYPQCQLECIKDLPQGPVIQALDKMIQRLLHPAAKGGA